MIDSTQEVMINFNRADVVGVPLYKVLTPTAASEVMATIDTAFKTGLPLWYAYTLGNHSFLCLVEKVDRDTVAVHEVIDSLEDRARIEKFLLVASGNFHKKLYKKEVG